MPELFRPNPEIPTDNSPEPNLAVGGLSRVIERVRDFRANRIEKKINHLDQAIADLEESTDINSLTAQHALITGPDLYGPKDEDAKNVVEAHKGSGRPVTRAERKTVRKTESKLRGNTHLSGHLHDLHTIYDVVDPAYRPDDLPDRRPGVGNREVRQAIDERLRRQKGTNGEPLLKDQPARKPAPKLSIGTPEYTDNANSLRLSSKSRRAVAGADRKVNKYGTAVSKNVAYVEAIAQGVDQRVEKLKTKRAKLVAKINPTGNTPEHSPQEQVESPSVDHLDYMKQAVETSEQKDSNLKVTVETRSERAKRLAKERVQRKSSKTPEQSRDPKSAKEDFERRQNPPNYTE
jgi:hypothetical protein